MLQHIAVVNSSTLLKDTDVLYMAAACALQVKRDFCPAWGLSPISVGFYPSGVLPRRTWVMELVDDIPEAPGALAYHTEDGDVVSGRIGVGTILQNGGVPLYDSNGAPSVASALSHEILETIVDPFVNDWCDGPEGQSYAKETADPVESSQYLITVKGNPVAVSNFVTPRYFDTQAVGGVLDFMGQLTAPFSLAPGGYYVIRDASGSPHEVFGEVKPEAWRIERRSNAWSRLNVRLGRPEALTRLATVKAARR